MTDAEKLAMLRGAAYMREKIAQCLESSPRKAIHESGARVRDCIRLPREADVENASEKWIDFEILSDFGDDEPQADDPTEAP